MYILHPVYPPLETAAICEGAAQVQGCVLPTVLPVKIFRQMLVSGKKSSFKWGKRLRVDHAMALSKNEHFTNKDSPVFLVSSPQYLRYPADFFVNICILTI